eukprot:superscaffoldBa00003025_g15918
MSMLSFQRQKERKKLEREERMEDVSEQGEEVPGVASESDSEEELKAEEEWTAVRPKNKCSPESVPAFITTENKSNRQPPHRTSEEGIQMFEQGQYSQAVDMFTEAIYCDPKNHRFYGNRSSCYCRLEQYSSALTDAQRSIQLAPDWPMGYCYKASALMWLKRYMEVEKVMEDVLKLDQHCKEASSILSECRILQLMELGFEEEQSKLLLEKFTTVQAILTSPDAKALKHTPQQDQS